MTATKPTMATRIDAVRPRPCLLTGAACSPAAASCPSASRSPSTIRCGPTTVADPGGRRSNWSLLVARPTWRACNRYRAHRGAAVARASCRSTRMRPGPTTPPDLVQSRCCRRLRGFEEDPCGLAPGRRRRGRVPAADRHAPLRIRSTPAPASRRRSSRSTSELSARAGPATSWRRARFRQSEPASERETSASVVAGAFASAWTRIDRSRSSAGRWPAATSAERGINAPARPPAESTSPGQDAPESQVDARADRLGRSRQRMPVIGLGRRRASATGCHAAISSAELALPASRRCLRTKRRAAPRLTEAITGRAPSSGSSSLCQPMRRGRRGTVGQHALNSLAGNPRSRASRSAAQRRPARARARSACPNRRSPPRDRRSSCSAAANRLRRPNSRIRWTSHGDAGVQCLRTAPSACAGDSQCGSKRDVGVGQGEFASQHSSRR